MAAPGIRPRLVVADAQGNIYDDPELQMVCRKGYEFSLPKPEELIPLPEGSELFLLPGRNAVGMNPQSGQLETTGELAVAAFVSPAHTLTAHAAYMTQNNAPVLPLFAYGAVGYAHNRFYVCAKKVDEDVRQVFTGIPQAKIEKKARELMRAYPKNRLMRHLMTNCVLTYACPAARNLALGRYEAPLPVSKACNARCVGCISKQESGSKICASPQNRMDFTPTAQELLEVMWHHARNETRHPIYSFGQGCEGEPLTQADLLEETIRTFRAQNGPGTINLNSNASMPEAIARLGAAGLTSLRVSMSSARPKVYERYYRPANFTFADVRQSILNAKKHGVFVSINLLYFPGVSDTEPELAALLEFLDQTRTDFIQLRNLNIDPELYLNLLADMEFGPSMGLANFRKRIRKACPWIRFGYFNPAVAADIKESTEAEEI